MVDPSQIIQGLLFGLFFAVTATLAAVTGPTYDNLLVPQLQAGNLYPPLGPAPPGGPTFLGEATGFSSYLVTSIVDPSIALVAVAIGILYLGRAVFGPTVGRLTGLLPRVIVAVVLANFTLPVAGAILGLAGAVYPVVAGFDGGAWQQWVNLAGWGELGFSWDNGAVAFIISIALFGLVFGLAAAVALRDALLGVVLVLLPVFTLLWPIPSLAPLARRAWWLFGELAFLPCVVVIPLELAVHSSSILLLLGYLSVAVSAPALLGVAGAQLSSIGFLGAGGFLAGGFRQGMGSASQGAARVVGPAAAGGSGRVARAIGTAARTTASAPANVAFPLLAADALGRGTAHLVRHVGPAIRRLHRPGDSFPRIQRPGGPGP